MPDGMFELGNRVRVVNEARSSFGKIGTVVGRMSPGTFMSVYDVKLDKPDIKLAYFPEEIELCGDSDVRPIDTETGKPIAE